MTANYHNPAADQWYESIICNPASFPFAFHYGDTEITGFGEDQFASITVQQGEADGKRTARIEGKTRDGLLVVADVVHNPAYGVTEWTVRFENTADHDTLPISNPRAVLTFPGRYPVLKGILGDHTNWYRPYSMDLAVKPVHFESNSGRATHVNFPYFNLEHGDGGTMLAIGWAGTWRADFAYDADSDTTAYTAGSVNRLQCALHPGEVIRTALFVRAAYTTRREDYATNYWRSWFIHCNLPKADSQSTPLAPFSTTALASDTGLPNSDGSISERYFTWRPSMEKMLSEGIHPDFRWFDAGWYVAPDGHSEEVDWWGSVGTWTLDPAKWPDDSFLESTDYAREHGMKTLMWFEPERVTDPDSLAANWGYNRDWAIPQRNPGDPKHIVISNNIGREDCLCWTLDKITSTLRHNRVEMYREDNNSDQAALWNMLDDMEGENRQGITECRFIDAHYRMWDEIIACTLSFGGCGFVDSCASGGGRNDLESLRRGIPLLRSDYDRTTTGMRLSMTSSFNQWVPFCGAINKEKGSQLAPKGVLDMYVWRASYLPVLNIDSQYAQDPDQDFDMIRKGLNEWKSINRFLLKDFYPLTPWHTQEETTGFTALAYFDPQAEEGIVLAFRQEHCDECSLNIALPFAERDASYTLTDADSDEVMRADGVTAHQGGIELRFDQPRTARLLRVKKV